ncbi:HSP18 transcriptional regulator [Amycolatopsis sp. NPDC059021]|uniref:HSP18 transcriptional regulator n=1 Tax=Amycolatopsis sp. NPDC059021 TaxID=3346704 RepID=UPI00366D2D89
MEEDPIATISTIHDVVSAVRQGSATPDQLLAALTALRLLRGQIAAWEPELITAARDGGTSWAALAPALGVASRQAAERRYLRLRPSAGGEGTGEARVDAQRDRRAADRAVSEWARRNSALLRRLAGQVSAVDGLDKHGRLAMEQLGDALGEDDAAALLPPLAEAGSHLGAEHGDLADRLRTVAEHTDQVRRAAIDHRRGRG